MSYNPVKAAQLIAKLLILNHSRPMNIVKVVKLVYLCDRTCIEKWGFPILDENRVAMKHGPVNSTTYRYINGEAGPDPEGWKAFLSDRENHEIGLARDVSIDELDLLSAAEMAVIETVWEQFGKMDTWDLVKWTHDKKNIPEWDDPGDTSKPITLRNIMKAVGIGDVEEHAEACDDYRRIDALFSEIRVH